MAEQEPWIVAARCRQGAHFACHGTVGKRPDGSKATRGGIKLPCACWCHKSPEQDHSANHD